VSLNGVLLEKWAIKTLLNLGYIGALDPLKNSRIEPPDSLIGCLFDGLDVPDGVGLYFVTGKVNNHDYRNGLSWNSILNRRTGQIVGMAFTFNGVHFAVTLIPIRAERLIGRLNSSGVVDYANAKVFYLRTSYSRARQLRRERFPSHGDHRCDKSVRVAESLHWLPTQ
jgi:hypothetical protein